MLKKIILIFTILIPFVYSQICQDIPEFGYVASQEDCYIYYQCIDGYPFRLQCPRGNYFSTARQNCVPYDESDCVLLGTTTSPPNEIPTCSDVPEFGYIPSLEACDFYYQCIENDQFLLKCPRGFYFSFRDQNCVHPDESDCPLISTTTTSTSPPNEIPTCSDVPEFGYIPSLEACDFYYQCIENDQFLLKCPRGFYFSFRSQNCVHPDESDCPLIFTTTTSPPIISPTCDDVEEFSLIPSSRGCEFYYQCIQSEQFLLECPRGFFFNFEQQNCLTFDESDCGAK